MTTTPSTTRSVTERLGDAHGNLTMLALDQRESLRTMFTDAGHADVGDDDLRRFKVDGVRILSPHASAVLLDRPLGLAADGTAPLAEGSRLILAADVLLQQPGGAVTGSELDPEVTEELVRASGAEALKFLVIWRQGTGVAERADLVGQFLDLARRTGTVSLLEGIVRTGDGSPFARHEDRHDAIVEAATELASFGPDVYKAEVPGYVPGDQSGVQEEARRLSAAIDVPWVVLSNGTRAEDFREAVGQACAGGASGFLAGRAVWADTVPEADYSAAMADRSVRRLQDLAETVRQARPA